MSDLDTKVRAFRSLPPVDMRRAIRRAAGLTQADCAREIGVTRETISRYETAVRAPLGPRLVAYAELLEHLQELVAQ